MVVFPQTPQLCIPAPPLTPLAAVPRVSRHHSLWSNPCLTRQPIPTNTKQYQPISTNTNQYQPLPTNINQYQPISTNTNQYQPISTNINQYQPIPTNINHYQPISTNTNQYQPISTTTDQKPYNNNNMKLILLFKTIHLTSVNQRRIFMFAHTQILTIKQFLRTFKHSYIN